MSHQLPALRAAAGLVFLGLAVAGPVAQVGDRADVDTAPPPAHWRIPPAPVRTPEESMRLMDLADGFVIELVAAEPLVQDPIAFAFDERSRLWVLEWAAYNWPLREVLGLPPAPSPPGRLVVVTDADGDGRLDTRTVFTEVEWPRGFQLIDGGVLMFALPDVLFLRDTDGDDRADTRDVVSGGLPIPVNPHLAPSSPSWTLDNWTYGLQVSERLRVSAGRRIRGAAGRLAGQWGMSHDDAGRLVFSYNQDHLRGSLVPVHYATRNPHYTATAGIDVRIGLDNEVAPHAITPGVNRRAQLHDDGRLRVFTANAAPHIYRGDQFPDDFRGNAFVGESAGRLIRRSIVTERDGILTGHNAYEGREFLFSHDERVRPVYTTTGPDGALYVADMYRGVIEGHIFLTTFLRNQIVARGLQHPFSGMGRIYRIRHAGRPLGAIPRVPREDVAAWVPLLGHANGHWRDLAQRTIVTAGRTELAPAIGELARTHASPPVRLQALWTLEGLDALDDGLLAQALRDGSPHVRSVALRLAETRLDTDATLRTAALRLAGDASPMVRRQLVYSLGESQRQDVQAVALQVALADLEQPFVADALASGAAGREADLLATILGRADWQAAAEGRRALIAALTQAVAQAGDAAAAQKLVAQIADANAALPAWQRRAVLDGLAAADGPAAVSARPRLDALLTSADVELGAEARRLAERWAAGKAAGTAALDPDVARRVEAGRAAFALCAACHQADGKGLASLAPPLDGAATVNGPAAVLIDILLDGRDVDPAYPSMPPMGGLPDAQLAAILTYVRQAWSNAAAPVSVEDVRARRAAKSSASRAGNGR